MPAGAGILGGGSTGCDDTMPLRADVQELFGLEGGEGSWRCNAGEDAISFEGKKAMQVQRVSLDVHSLQGFILERRRVLS